MTVSIVTAEKHDDRIMLTIMYESHIENEIVSGIQIGDDELKAAMRANTLEAEEDLKDWDEFNRTGIHFPSMTVNLTIDEAQAIIRELSQVLKEKSK